MDNKSLDQILELLQFDKIFTFIVLMGILVFVVKIFQSWGKKLGQKWNSKRLLILQVVTIVSFFLYLIGMPVILYSTLRPPKELLIAVGGSAAVAIGFAIKDVVGSFVAGIVLLFDRPLQVGDRVQIGDCYGEVKSIGLRAIRVITLDDNVVTIPNIKLINDPVSSGNFGALDMLIEVPFYISIEEDIEKVRDLLYEIVVTSKYAFLAKPVSVVTSEVQEEMRLAIKMTVKAYVLDVRYEKAFQTDLVNRATKEFNRQKILRPRFS